MRKDGWVWGVPCLIAHDWITVERPVSRRAVRLGTDLGAGETEVLMLGLETHQPVEILHLPFSKHEFGMVSPDSVS